MESRQEIKSLKKALRALTFLNELGDATVTDVARAVGIPRTTAHRVLTTLASEGYVEKQSPSDYYRLTSRVTKLASGFQTEMLLLELAKPLVAEAGKELGWPLAITMPRDGEMFIRLATDHECPRALERFQIGFSVPIVHATAGFCYLAHASADERQAALAAALRAARERHMGIENPLEIEYLINRTRKQGFCNLEFPQYREGNVAVPLEVGGRVVGGLVMRYIKSTLRNTGQIQSSYVPRLQALARRIAEQHDAWTGPHVMKTSTAAGAAALRM
jgi:IclR family transcriptional regulator, mhp operon transcriptional activator